MSMQNFIFPVKSVLIWLMLSPICVAQPRDLMPKQQIPSSILSESTDLATTSKPLKAKSVASSECSDKVFSTYSKGQISGIVTNTNGQALANTEVNLYVSNKGASQTIDPEWLSFDKRMTDVQGHYSFDNLASDTYKIDFLLPNYPHKAYEDIVVYANKVTAINTEIDTDLGRIQGKVYWHSLPAKVEVYAFKNNSVVMQTITDSTGQYELRLPEDNYSLQFSPPLDGAYICYEKQEQCNYHYLESSAQPNGQEIEIKHGKIAQAQSVSLPFEIHLSGIVSAADTQNPLANVVIQSQTKITEPNANGYLSTLSTKTDSNGYFALLGRSAATVRLQFDLPNSNYLTNYYSNELDINGEDDILIPASGLKTMRVNLELGGSFGGVIKPALQDEIDSTNPFFLLRNVDRQLQPQAWAGAYNVEIDPSTNQYKLSKLTPGKYRIRVNQINYFSDNYEMGNYYPQSDSLANAADIEVKAGQYTGNIDFQLKPSATIAGQITDTNNQPIPGIEVRIYDGHNIDRRMLTDVAGNYRVKGLAKGTYQVSAANSGQTNLPFANDSYPSNVYIEPGQTAEHINIQLQAGGCITGHLDFAQHHLAAYREILLIKQKLNSKPPSNQDFLNTPSTATDLSGNYALQHVFPGDYDVYSRFPTTLLGSIHVSNNKMLVVNGIVPVAECPPTIAVADNENMPTYDFDSGLLSLPGIYYLDNNIYSATLKNRGDFSFKLINAEKITPTNTTQPQTTYFSRGDAMLIQTVLASGYHYCVQLSRIADLDWTFKLEYISTFDAK